MTRLTVVVTCGPSYEPLDQVRRLTNFSTGELGVALTEALAGRGHRVTCFKGSGAIYRDPEGMGCRVEHFNTNADLQRRLRRVARARDGRVDAVLHAAALCDFEVDRVETETGRVRGRSKISSRVGTLVVYLRPAVKLLGSLRRLFPASTIVGWKYELERGRGAALAAARAQLEEAATDACVVNGRAYGSGFGVVWRGVPGLRHLRTRMELAQYLADELERRVGAVRPRRGG